MDSELPPPGKALFHYPTPPEALEFIRHPGGVQDFESTGRDEDGRTLAANGYLAVRFDSFMPDQFPAGDRLRERVETLAWERFDDLKDPKHWRVLDNVRPTLFKFPARPMWEHGRRRYHFRRGPTVRIGDAFICQLATLQFLSRLPRAEVWTRTTYNENLYVRFNGGQAIVPKIKCLDQERFSLWSKRDPVVIKGGLV